MNDHTDTCQTNILADQVACGRITFEDGAHRLFQYWETSLTRGQAQRELQQCINAMIAQRRDPHWP